MKKLGKKRLTLIIAGAAFLAVGLIGLLATFFTREQQFPLDADQFGSAEFVDINGEEYEQLLSAKKSFLVFVDQDGCITAKGLRQIATEIAEEKSLKIYHIMFSDARSTSLYNNVKYYPSFVIVKQGKVVSWLKADSDEDTERYKNKDELLKWLNNYIKWS